MYVTAHNVESRDHRVGINAFGHVHADSWPQQAMDRRMIRMVADEVPGDLVASMESVPPGGNSVRSYLDIVAPDGTSPATVRSALDAFASVLADSESTPVSDVISGVGLRLGANIGLDPQRIEEFERLRERALLVLEECERRNWRPR
jgi:hypothetical protein